MLTSINFGRGAVTAGAVRQARGLSNRLLDALISADPAFVERRTLTVSVKPGEQLFDIASPLSTVYFPLSAVVSLMQSARDGATCASGFVGSDGIVGIDCVLGAGRTSSRAVVRQPGLVVCAPVNLVTSSFDSSAVARSALIAYAHEAYVATSKSVLCSQRHTVQQRVSLQLLQIFERANSRELMLSQDCMGEMLGVRREGVTEAAGILREMGIIEYRRGRLTVIDPAGLSRQACDCYDGRHRAVSAQRVRPEVGAARYPRPQREIARHLTAESALA